MSLCVCAVGHGGHTLSNAGQCSKSIAVPVSGLLIEIDRYLQALRFSENRDRPNAKTRRSHRLGALRATVAAKRKEVVFICEVMTPNKKENKRP